MTRPPKLAKSATLCNTRVMSNKSAATCQEPTDQQLSKLLGGTPVFSLRPEDLVHFTPDIRESISPQQAEERLMDLFNRVTARFPHYGQPPTELTLLSKTKSAALHSLHTRIYPPGVRTLPGTPTHGVSFFVLMRQSLKIDRALMLANDSRIDPALIANPVDIETARCLSVWHEFGHMFEHKNNLELPNSYHKELHADYTALKQVSREAGNHIIKPYILERALSGFFAQPPRYWLAPQLSRIFSDSADAAGASLNFEKDMQDRIWASYAELRLRTIADVGLNDRLDLYSSKTLQAALSLWNNNNADAIADVRLRQYCQLIDVARNDKNIYTRTGDMFQSLARTTALPQLDPLTRECGEQILEAGRMYCPRVTPRP